MICSGVPSVVSIRKIHAESSRRRPASPVGVKSHGRITLATTIATPPAATIATHGDKSKERDTCLLVQRSV